MVESPTADTTESMPRAPYGDPPYPVTAMIRSRNKTCFNNMTSTDERNQRLLAFLHLLGRFRDEDAAIYNSMAAGYESFSKVWEEEIARPALEHLLKSASRRIPPHGRVLDAGCGTGLRIPDIATYFKPRRVFGLDVSSAMLDVARRKKYGVPVSFEEGNLHALPYEDESMDAVIATWSVETTSNPGHAVREFLRVLKPGGVVAYSYVQIPKSISEREILSKLDTGQKFDQLGEALSPEHLPFHNCSNSELRHFAEGVISTVILGKCCEVSPGWLPKPFDFDEFISETC
ncbi:MAG: hypothetical protein CML13_06080 [Puniceicoccaceae bacterium]|nr:hypothetical protein [Puniceicoccaceae bacterium]